MEDWYNIKNYNNEELYNILDLNNNPTDRELEASIIQKIKQSRSLPVQNASTKKIVEFFVSVYDRFFSEAESDNSQTREYTDDELFQEGFSQMNISNTILDPKTPQTITIGSGQASSADIITESDARNLALSENKDNELSGKNQAIQTIKQLDYVKGKINPLLKQTIKRVIYIDSQNRDKQFEKTNVDGTTTYITRYISTDFTFDLSEPLRDVVALRLYSVSIPYTYYTVNSNFGGNFFYLKGNSPGIDNETFYYKVEVSPGFYDQTALTAAVNSSLNTLKTTYTDVSFGTTYMSYNSTEITATLNLDIKNFFSENDYQIIFPSTEGKNIDASGNLPSRYNQSLAAYLGYNTTTYDTNAIYSLRNLPLTTADNYGPTQTARDYTLTDSNKSFTIIQYQGPGEYTGQTALSTTTISLTLTTDTTYSRAELEENLNTVLAASPYLTNSSITRVNITDISAINTENSYYKLTINLNKSNASIKKGEDLKTVIIFPLETGSTSPIWIQNASTGCFRFQKQNNELSNIYGETPIFQSSYPIQSNPYIVFKCNAAGYNSSYSGNYNIISDSKGNITANTSGMYVNDMKIILINGTYTLNQYISAINTSLNTFNNTYSVFPNNNTEMELNNTTGKMSFYIDINRTFDETKFDISFSSFFVDSGGNGFELAPLTSYHLNTTSSWTSTEYKEKSTYVYNQGDILFTIYPNSSISQNPLAGVSPWVIRMAVGYNATNKNRNDFITFLNKSMQEFQSSIGDYPLSNSSFNISSNGTEAIASLNINITNTLTENNYSLYFFDPSNNFNANSNSWVNNLKYVEYYPLLTTIPGQTYALVIAETQISAYSWTINEATSFIIKGTTNGVSTTSGTNDITINIPHGTYTYEQLFNEINTQFANNPLTVGSTINRGTKTNPVGDYAMFHLNINKTFTTTDYKVVFYDTTSFVKCNFGVSGVKNATWDTTLGYLMGYRNNIEYDLLTYAIANPDKHTNNVVNFKGDQGFNTNTFRSFYIILDDFVQNRLNDGLVTITRQETAIPLPSYATLAQQQCVDGTPIFTGNAPQQGGNQLTQAQIAAANAIASNQRNSQSKKIMTQDPYIKDIFGIIPMKQGKPGELYTEFGGTLQNQERLYFGPVNIHRMRIKLVDDKGNTVDLNNADWSFSFVCEQLYQQSSIGG
jgi:hypothetical protein